MHQNYLLLGSQSKARKLLLEQAGIPFNIVGHNADEQACDWGVPLLQLVDTIARHKMEAVLLEDGKDGEIAFILTADTLCESPQGLIYGKPISQDDAFLMIKGLRGKGTIATAFYLEKRVFSGNTWKIEKRIHQIVHAGYELVISDKEIQEYVKRVPESLSYAGAFSIEGYGAQFVRAIYGSYTTILGLPMVEVRQALKDIGFLSS